MTKTKPEDKFIQLKVYRTYDYDKFKKISYNRQVDHNQAHILRLANSIKMRNLMATNPIRVTKDFEIIDGQNRLKAARIAGAEVFYVIDEDFETQHLMLAQIQKNWNTDDFVNYYANLGYEEYVKLTNFCNDNKGMKISTAVALTTNGELKYQIFNQIRDGIYKFDFNEKTQNKIEILELLQRHTLVDGSKDWIKSRKLINAINTIVQHPEFEMDRFTKNLVKYIGEFGVRGRMIDYLMLFQNIYNRNYQYRVKFYDDLSA